MRQIDVYEPALCCSSGVCGTDVDQSLVDFNAALGALKRDGVEVARHNLASAPTDFAECESVRSLMEVAGVDALPATVVDGAVVLTAAYPTEAQLRQFAGEQQAQSLPIASTGCCGGGEC